MNSSKKITIMLFSMLLLLSMVIIISVSISSRYFIYDGAKRKAYLTAELVKNALTHQMVHKIIDHRDAFFKRFNNLHYIKDIWVSRSPSIDKQFGKSSLISEKPRDNIDFDVLKTGKEKIITNESLDSVSLRITIPYTASQLSNPNCMSCHDAEEGEVLGAISLVFDMSEDRNSNIIIMIQIIVILVIFVILIAFLIKQRIIPFTKSFDSLTQTLKQVHEGNYSVRAQEGTLKEDKEASLWLNDLIEKLEIVLTKIEKNLTLFVHRRTNISSKDKLITAKEIIEDLTEIYNYKKTIETDLTKDDIYYRLVQILKNKLKIETFHLFETNLIKDQRTIVYSTDDQKEPYCTAFNEIKDNCRAERLNSIVFSDNFPEICKAARCEYKDIKHGNCIDNCLFICIPFLINEKINIVIHITCKDKESMTNVKNQMGIIKKYLEETKPILESKILMEVLKEKNLTDELTKLYNRRYLDEFIEKKLPIEMKNGSIFSILFLDIDYFKFVNDTYGHDTGDKVLKKLSNTMKNSISKDDFIVRFGGEEFLIFVKNPTEKSALDLANKINQDFAKIIFTYNGQSFSKTVSVGYSFFPNDSNDIWKCIKYADISLYTAKERGRNKVIRFSEELLENSDKK